MEWHEQYCFAVLYVLLRMHASVVVAVIPQLQFLEVRPAFLHPVQQVLESFTLGVVWRQYVILLYFIGDIFQHFM